MAAFDPANPIPDIIVQEAGRLNNIITDFLNFARPRSRICSPAGSEEIIEKNLTSWRLGYGTTVVIHKEYAENLPPIVADSEMLYQAFLNILINAMQAMPREGTSTSNRTFKDNHVHMIFEDQVAGLAADLEKFGTRFLPPRKRGRVSA